MLNICERFANDNKILFNASKNQLLYFSKNDDPIYVMRPILRISHGEMVPYVEKCIHLGNTLSTSSRIHDSGDNESVLINTLNIELEKLNIWLQANKLTINVSKSYYMIFHRRRRRRRRRKIDINNPSLNKTVL